VTKRFFEVPARKLIQIGPDDKCWAESWKEGPIVDGGVEGAFVKICPPAGCADNRVISIKELLLEAGAISVRTMPKPKEDAPLPEVIPTPTVRSRDARKVVATLLDNLNHEDVGGVRREVEAALAAENL
jgi:hypothetical protein